MKVNMFGRGFKLQLAIIVACQMAFVLFGKIQDPHTSSIEEQDF